MVEPSQRVIIIGGGLAGLTAAIELLEKGCNVTILEKNENLGGNSSKATCGIAAPGSALQKAAGVQDSGADLIIEGPEAVALIRDGPQDVDWLLRSLGVNDELVLRLTPGHGKTARTVSAKAHFPGQVITYAAIQILSQIAQSKPERVQIATGAAVIGLLTAGTNKVTGVEYARAGATEKVMGQVVLATGGFAGDTSANSLLARYAPNLLNFPTTSEERANGDGIKLATAVGAGAERLNSVVAYPTATGLPGQEDAAFKFVISDALCGAGAKLLNADGSRFVDELASSQVRTDAMLKAKGPFRLVLSSKDAKAVQWIVDFYSQRRVLSIIEGGAKDLAKLMKVPVANLRDVGDGVLYVATVTPAVYSCAGGITTGWDKSSAGRVLGSHGKPIEGLFAAGEVSAVSYTQLWSKSGIPLLHCIYSGLMAGRAAASVVLGGKPGKEEDIKHIVLHSISVSKQPLPAVSDAPAAGEKKLEDMSKEELVEKIKALQAGGAVAAAAPAAAGPPAITLEEVAKHKSKTDAWIVLFGEVYDVTRWIPIHPGGEQAIMSFAGMDATEEWQMIHKPGTIEKNMQHLTKKGSVGAGGGGGASKAGAAPAAGGGGIPYSEIEKHNTKADAWVVLFGEVYDVTKWIPIHPGGEGAVVAYAGKDATEEWQMIHKPGTIEKNMQHLTKKGKAEGGSVVAAKPAAAVDDSPPPPQGNGGIPGFLGALIFMLKSIIVLALKTIFFTGNVKFGFDNNRTGTIRSAVFLLTFTIIHALGNFADMLGGPDELNGEGYLFDRIGWTGSFGLTADFPISVVEEYLLLALILHVSVALKRSWDISMNYCLYTGSWNMMISGLVVLTFLMRHLSDFRLNTGLQHTQIYVPKYFVAFENLRHGYIFADTPEDGVLTTVRDLYSQQVVVFKNFWNVMFYTTAITVFVMHLMLGWKKVVTADAMQIPTDHVKNVKYLGWAAALAVAGMYISIPWYVYFAEPQVLKHIK